MSGPAPKDTFAAGVRVWRLIIDPPRPGAWNMAFDEALLEAVGTGQAPPTVRFYRWAPPCLSLGAFQPADAVDRAACADLGIDVVRRPTGGGAVLHDREVTYSVVLPPEVTGRRPREVYLKICLALLQGLERLGVRAGFAPPGSYRRPAGPSCFAQASDYEVLVDGRKVVGSAQVWRSGTLLQHGAVLLAADRTVWAQVMGQPDAAGGLIGLGELMPGLTFEQVASALAVGFEGQFGAELVPSDWTRSEVERAGQLVRQKYGRPAWTARI